MNQIRLVATFISLWNGLFGYLLVYQNNFIAKDIVHLQWQSDQYVPPICRLETITADCNVGNNVTKFVIREPRANHTDRLLWQNSLLGSHPVAPPGSF